MNEILLQHRGVIAPPEPDAQPIAFFVGGAWYSVDLSALSVG